MTDEIRTNRIIQLVLDDVIPVICIIYNENVSMQHNYIRNL